MGPAIVKCELDGERPGDPNVSAIVKVVDGRPVLAELTATMRPGGREVELRDFARLFTASPWVTEVWSDQAVRPETDQPPFSGVVGGADDEQHRAICDDVNRSRNRKTPPAELERVAEIYREHAAHPDGKPTEAVMATLGYGSRATTSRRIQEAERAGLLPATTRGKRRGA